MRREGFPGLPLEIGFAKARVRLVAFGIRGAITLMGYFAIASLGNSAFAQITPDSTLPGEPSVLTPSVIINDLLSDRIDGGAIRGANLFHSFLQFNIGNGEQVYFANPPGIENILGRVTGTEPSNILGTLGVTGGDANLFLINPNGIIFGSNARLDLGGSFVATTANAIEFPDGSIFSASAGNIPSATLTVNPSAFLFNQLADQQTSSIEVRNGAVLSVGSLGNPESLLLVGGNVQVDGGTLEGIEGSQVEIAGFTGSGSVGLSMDDNNKLTLILPANGVIGADVVLTNGALVNVGSESGNAGSILLVGETLSLTGGTQLSTSTFGVGDAGIVFLQADHVSIDNSTIFSTMESTATGNPGGILMQADSISLTSGATLTATTRGVANAGLVFLNASGPVSIANGSTILSMAEAEASGNSGGILIQAAALSLTDSTLNTNNLGSGIAGDIVIDTRDQVSLVNSEIVSSSNNDETSDFGFIELAATEGSVLLNQSTLNTTNSGSGLAGDIIISARDQLSIFNQSNIFSEGNFGRILIGQSDAYDDSFSPDIVNIDSSILSTANPGSAGVAGDISIDAINNVLITSSSIVSETLGIPNAGNISVQSEGSVSLTNGTIVSTSTFGQGNAGLVTVGANAEVLIDNHSGILSDVGLTGTGNAGGIGIEAGSLSLTNGATLTSQTYGVGNAGVIALQIDGDVSLSSGASLTTQTFGIGNSGIVLVQAGGNVSLTGSNTGIFSTVEEGAIGSTIGIDIEARSLSMNGGANLQALTRGEGNAGIILVNASDFVSLSGVSPDGFSTGLFTSTEDRATGIGGFIGVNTGSLRLSDGAVLSARTRNAFTGGDIVVNVNTLDATNGGQILTTAFSTGPAGNITVIAANSITLSGRDPTFTDRFNQTVANFGPVLAPQVFDNVAPGSSGLFANTSADSNAEGGDINVSTRDLFVRNEAQVTVNNQGSGSAGNLQIKASRDIQLRNQGSITAETRSGEGGNITLDVGGFLLLLRNSEISTTAGTANAGGDGGDITINTQSDIIAAPANNNDIKANAFTGTGGNIQITAAALRAIARRPLNLKTNDINASSTLGIDGLVTTSSTLNLDPTQSLTNLPQTPVDASRLLAQNCPAPGRSSSREENKFTITGRGGLPPNPNDTLQSESVVTPWVTLDPPVENRMGNATSTNLNSSALASSVPKTPTYAEAQGWIIGEKGEIILTAQASTVTPHHPSLTPATFCNGS